MNFCFTVLSDLPNDEVFKKFLTWRSSSSLTDRAEFLQELYRCNAQDDFSAYVRERILYDVNPYSISAANHLSVSPFIVKALINDITLITFLLSKVSPEEQDLFRLGNSLADAAKDAEAFIASLGEYYAQYGYGDYIRYRAFCYENNDLRPITAPSAIKLSDLKEYEEEKKIVSDNLESFLEGLPCSNMLLYGERGTGKSSTIHAMLNHYYDRGLRLVQLSKENMLSLGKLKELLRSVPLKFMIYIDDLSLNSGDERISSLKAALEGCSEGNTENAIIVATSNRRHIIDEKFSQREDSVHSGDSMQEELSLSDRFGISVLFTTTNKEHYLSIIHQMLSDRKIEMNMEQLDVLAERWAIVKGGRSPRRAKQFVDLVQSFYAKGLPVTF